MKKLLYTLLSLLIITSSGFIGFFTYLNVNNPYKEFSSYSEEIQEAKKLYDNEKYKESIEKIKDINDKIPGNSYKYYLSLLEGKSLYHMSNYSSAITSFKNFEQFLTMDDVKESIGNTGDIEYEKDLYLALSYYHNNDYITAKDYFKKAIENKSNITEKRYSITVEDLEFKYAKVLYENNLYKDSLDILQSLMKTNNLPNELKAKVFALIGDIYYHKLNDNNKSVSYYENSIAILPSIETSVSLSKIYLETEQFEKGLDLIQQIIQVNHSKKDISSLFTYQGVFLYKLHAYQESALILQNNLEKVQDNDSFYITNLMYLMYSYYQTQDYDNCLEVIEIILSEDTHAPQEVIDIAEEYKEDVVNYVY